MAWQDVMSFYSEPDDYPDAPAVELLTLPCPACGKPVTAPADAEGDDLCCGPACVKVVCDRMDAELRELRAGPWPVEVAWADADVPY